jgi:hypothetical protein
MEINSDLIKETSDEDLIDFMLELDKRSDQEYQNDKSAYEKTRELIKEIGRELHCRGGEKLMRNILLIAGSEGCNTDFIEREWSGIGSWLG